MSINQQQYQHAINNCLASDEWRRIHSTRLVVGGIVSSDPMMTSTPRSTIVEGTQTADESGGRTSPTGQSCAGSPPSSEEDDGLMRTPQRTTSTIVSPCPSGSPPARHSRKRSMRKEIATKWAPKLLENRAAVCGALFSGDSLRVSSALDSLKAIPQLIWSELFQAAMLTTSPSRIGQLVAAMLDVADTRLMSDADHQLPAVAAWVAGSEKSLACYELFTRASLTPWMRASERYDYVLLKPKFEARNYRWHHLSQISAGNGRCPWNAESAMYEMSDALECGDHLRATQSAFALVAAGRNYAVKFQCRGGKADLKGSAFLRAINLTLRCGGARSDSSASISISSQRRVRGIRLEALAYLLIASAVDRSQVMCTKARAELILACRACIKITESNTLFCPYTMCAALVGALLPGRPTFIAQKPVPFSGLLASQLQCERYEPADLALGRICAIGDDSSCWSLIEEAQFGRMDGVGMLPERVSKILEPVWNQWFPHCQEVSSVDATIPATTTTTFTGTESATGDLDLSDDNHSAGGDSETEIPVSSRLLRLD